MFSNCLPIPISFCFTAAIKAGYYDVGIAAGVETMTSNPMKWEGGMNPRVASSSDAQSCLIPMGVTSENIAEKWCVYFNSRMSNSTDAVFCSHTGFNPRADRRRRRG